MARRRARKTTKKTASRPKPAAPAVAVAAESKIQTQPGSQDAIKARSDDQARQIGLLVMRLTTTEQQFRDARAENATIAKKFEEADRSLQLARTEHERSAARVAEFEGQINKLNKQRHELEEARKRDLSASSELQAQLSREQGKRKALEDRLTADASQSDYLKKTIADLQFQLQSEHARLKEAQERRQIAEDLYKAAEDRQQAAIVSLSAEAAHLKGTVEELRAQLDRSQARLDQKQAELTSQLIASSNEQATLLAANERLSADKSHLESELLQLRESAHGLRQQLAEAEGRFRSVQNEQSLLTGTVDSLQKQLDGSRVQLEQKQAELAAQSTESRAQQLALSSANEHLSAEKSRLEFELLQLSKSADGLREQLDGNKALFEKKQAELVAQSRESRAQQLALSSANERLIAEKSRLESELSRLSEISTRLEQQLASADKRYRDVQGEQSLLRQESDRNQASLAKLSETVSGLKAQNAALSAALKERPVPPAAERLAGGSIAAKDAQKTPNKVAEIKHKDAAPPAAVEQILASHIQRPRQGMNMLEQLRSWATGRPRAEGNADAYEEGHLIGWAVLPDQPREPAVVKVFLNGKLIATGEADIYRKDLEAAAKRGGRAGFRIPIVDALPAKEEARLVVRVEGCRGTLTGQPVVIAAEQVPAFEGKIDEFDKGRVRGWAWLPEHPAKPARIVAISDGKVIARCDAAEFRKDLKAAGKREGKCAFTLDLTGKVPAEGGPIELRLQGYGNSLSGSPVLAAARAEAELDGKVESYADGVVKGWAWFPAQPKSAALVKVLAGDIVVAKAPAELFRADLKDAGKRDGKCGFAIPIPEKFAGAALRVQAKFWDKDLPGSPLAAAQAQQPKAKGATPSVPPPKVPMPPPTAAVAPAKAPPRLAAAAIATESISAPALSQSDERTAFLTDKLFASRRAFLKHRQDCMAETATLMSLSEELIRRLDKLSASEVNSPDLADARRIADDIRRTAGVLALKVERD